MSSFASSDFRFSNNTIDPHAAPNFNIFGKIRNNKEYTIVSENNIAARFGENLGLDLSQTFGAKLAKGLVCCLRCKQSISWRAHLVGHGSDKKKFCYNSLISQDKLAIPGYLLADLEEL